MARRKEPVIPDAILDPLLAGADATTAFDPNGLLDQLKKALTERNSMGVVRVLSPFVGRVIIANPLEVKPCAEGAPLRGFGA